MSDPHLPPRPGNDAQAPFADARPEFVPVDPARAAPPASTHGTPNRPASHARSHSGMKVVGLVAGGLVLVTIVGVLLVMRGVRQMAHVAQAEQGRSEELVDYKEVAPSQVPPPTTVPSAVADAEAGLDEQPELSNPTVVQRALVAAYPPLQRDAGIPGEANVRFRVRADGSVDLGSMEVQSATNDDFARAALVVVPRMRFRPGKRGGQPAAGWVTLPVRWQTSK